MTRAAHVARRFERLAAPEVTRYLSSRSVLVLPIGSTEQHGPHLPLNTDTAIATEFARLLVDRYGQHHDLWALPAIPYGLSPEHAWSPGTISLRVASFTSLLDSVVGEYLRATPARGLLIVSGHSGNRGVLHAVLHELQASHAVRACAIHPASLSTVRIGSEIPEVHAGIAEISIMLALVPADVHLERLEAAGIADSERSDRIRRTVLESGTSWPWSSGDGEIAVNGVIGGDPRTARAELGQEIIDDALDSCAEVLAHLEARRMWRAESRPDASSPLSTEERTTFLRDGLLVRRRAIARNLINTARALIDEWYATSMDPENLDSYTQRTFAPDLGSHPDLLALFENSEARSLAVHLLGDIQPVTTAQIQIRVPQQQLPEAQPQKAMHVDGVSCPHLDPNELRTFSLLAGVMLSEVTDPQGGALHYQPGGHLEMAEWFRSEWSLGMTDQVPAHIDARTGMPLLGVPGDLLLMHHLVPHAVGVNHLPTARVMVYFRICHADHPRRRLQALQDPWLDYPPLAAFAQQRRHAGGEPRSC